MFRGGLITAAASLCVSAHALAGLANVTWTNTTSTDGVLNLAPDGVWNYGDDYWNGESTVVANEVWIGSYGSSVESEIHLVLEPSSEATPFTFPVHLMKNVTNTTNFHWSAFRIDIGPDPMSMIDNVAANANAAFDTVNVTDNGNGTFSILWEAVNSGGVGIGENTTFDFWFDVTGNLGFVIKQTPIPAPSTALALVAGGLLAGRRRRTA